MKRATVFFSIMFFFVIIAIPVGASELFYNDLSESQRYDLADAYNRVADKFDALTQHQRGKNYKKLAQEIYPGFGDTMRPVRKEKPVESRRPRQSSSDPSGDNASRYYFTKLLRGIFSENKSLTLSVIADSLYLPTFDDGVAKNRVSSELDWFFSKYDMDTVALNDIFRMNTIQVTSLDNGYWRLDIETRPEYSENIPDVTFWSKKMGFYFRKFPAGWRLTAIGPVT